MAPVIRSRYEQYKRDTQQLTTWLAQTAILHGYPLSKFDQEIGGDAEDVEIKVQSAASKKNARKKARAKELAQLAQKGLEHDHEISPSNNPLDTSGDQECRQLAGKMEGDLGVTHGNGMSGALQDVSRDQVEEGPRSQSGRGVIDGERKNVPSSNKPDLAQELGSSGLSGRYTLKLSLYVEVVQYIIDKGASIPIEVVRILKRCISLRLRASLRFAPTLESEASDKSHQYFIGILVKIRGIFERVNYTLDPSTPIPTQNQFTELSDESEDDAEDVPDIDIPRVVSSNPNMSFEPEMVIMEAINAIVMFLGDMERTRVYLGGLWKDYKSGKIDLITASVTTNTAIDLLQRPHDELMRRVMPVFGNDFQRMIIMTFGVLRGHTSDRLDTDLPNFDLVDDQDIELGKIYDFMMLPLVQVFVDLADKINSGSQPFPNSGQYGKYDPNADFSKLSFRSRWQQYYILLSKMFPNICFLLMAVGGDDQVKYGWDMDGVIRLMSQFTNTKEISFHLTFTIRIYMDINFILGSDTNRGRYYLHETAVRMIETLEQRPSVEGPIPHFRWTTRNDQIVSKLLGQASAAVVIVSMGLPLLERHPLLCGLIVFRLQMAYQDTGMALANTFASIQSAAHLYEACRHSGQPTGKKPLPRWPDMDLVLELHGKEQTFGGDVPTTIHESYLACQNLAGFSNHTLNGNAVIVCGPGCACSNKAGFEVFGDQTQILPIFKQSFSETNRTAVQGDMSAIEGLLRDLESREDRYPSTGNTRKSGRREYRKEKKHRAAKFSIIQLLSVLEKGLELETTSIRFDYVSMHLRCMRIFRNMKQMCDPYLAGKLEFRSINNEALNTGATFIKNDTMLPAMTGWIVNHSETNEGRGFKTRPKSSQILSKASNVFRQVLEIEGEGQVETLKVEYDRSK